MTGIEGRPAGGMTVQKENDMGAPGVVEPRTEAGRALAVDLGQTHDHEIGIHDSFEAVFAAQADALIARGWTRADEARAAALDAVEEAVKGLRRTHGPGYAEPVLAAIANLRSDGETR